MAARRRPVRRAARDAAPPAICPRRAGRAAARQHLGEVRGRVTDVELASGWPAEPTCPDTSPKVNNLSELGPAAVRCGRLGRGGATVETHRQHINNENTPNYGVAIPCGRDGLRDGPPDLARGTPGHAQGNDVGTPAPPRGGRPHANLEME